MRLCIYFILTTVAIFCHATSIPPVANDTTDWKMHYSSGEKYYSKGKLRQALSCYQKALELHVSDTIIHALSDCYYQRGYYQKSIGLYHTYMENDSSDTKLRLIAKCYDKLERPDSALIYRKMIAKQNIEDHNNIIALTQNYISLEQADSALQYLSQYTAIDSTNLSVNKLKAYVCCETGLYREAIELYEQIRQHGDEQTSTDYYQGLAYARVDSLNKAYDCLSRANEKSNRKNAYILSQLGVVSSKIGMIRESLKDIEEAIALLQPDKELIAYLYETAATDHIGLQQYEDAISYYHKVLEINPQKLNMLYQIAFLYNLVHNREKEIVFYKRFIKAVEKAGKPNKYANMFQDAQDYLKKLEVERFFQGNSSDK